MNIALIGYGKMGKVIEEVAIRKGHQIALKLTSKDVWDKDTLVNHSTDVAIEFTQPSVVTKNILTCFDANVPVVVGTTGWYQGVNEISQTCIEKNQAMLYASNFSIGVNLFFKINEMVAALMNKYNEYEVSVTEVHHVHKKDAPSGTAISIAEGILKYYPKKIQWRLDSNKDGLWIRARRVGDEKGYHSVCYQSEVDSIQIDHQAHSRKGFAIGAVLAAEYIKGKNGVFQMKDVLDFFSR